MLFNVPYPVWCVLGMFYGYGLFVLITGRAWDRWTGRTIRGARARIGGIGVLGLSVLFTVLVYYPARDTEVLATMFLWFITLFWAGRLIGEPEESPRRKRKNDEWDW